MQDTVSKNKRILSIIAQIAAWGCFFLLPYIFSPESKENQFKFPPHVLVLFVFINIYLLLFYYLNTLLLIPQLLFHRKWIKYTLIIIACFILFLNLPRFFVHLIFREGFHPLQYIPSRRWLPMREEMGGPPPHHKFHYFPGSYAVFIMVFTIGTCLSVIQQWLKTEQTKRTLENEKLNTELSFLKSQINPHFFFNTLNNIYSLSITGSDKTAPTILKLSSIMRYILSDTRINEVPIQSEIEFIKNYIDLQAVRLTDKVKVDFTTQNIVPETAIEPLLFLPFIENAFKYGISTKEKSTIKISLIQENANIDFEVTNNIVRSNISPIEKNEIGIQNVKRRLQLLYEENKYSLVAEKRNEIFFVHLHLVLK